MARRKPKGWKYIPYPFSPWGAFRAKYHYRDAYTDIYMRLLLNPIKWVVSITIWYDWPDDEHVIARSSDKDHTIYLPFTDYKHPPFNEVMAMTDLLRSR